MCLGSPTMTLSDLSAAVSRFAAAASAAIRCPLCNAAASGLCGLAAHLAEHQREQEAEEERRGRRGGVKVEAGTREAGSKENVVFAALNPETATDSGTQKEDGARYVGDDSFDCLPPVSISVSVVDLLPRTIWTSC